MPFFLFKIRLHFLFCESFLHLFFSNRSRNLCVGGTLDTGALREMRPRESALVAFLSSSYQPRNPVAVATRGCAGGLGGWVGLGWVAQRLQMSRKWPGSTVRLCLLEHLINSPLRCSDTVWHGDLPCSFDPRDNCSIGVAAHSQEGGRGGRGSETRPK